MDKDKNFSEWYNWIIREAGIIDDRYPVKGCPVYKPYGFILFREIMRYLEKKLEENEYLPSWFPIFIPEEIMKKETEHILGFEKETLYILDENRKLYIRPTSETEMYYMISLWVQAYTDLPLRLYMTNTVYRSETKATKPLIRGVEILWNEAHGTFKDIDQARRDIEISMRIYSDVYNYIHLPHFWVRRPEWDKFPGAEETYAADTIMPDGRFLQIGTTHLLGRKFSRVFNIKFYDKHPFIKVDYNTFEAYSKDGSIKFLIEINKNIIIIKKFEKGEQKDIVEVVTDKEFRDISEDNEELIKILLETFNKYFSDVQLSYEKNAWQISFGLSMRTLGALLSILGDNNGLILPFKIAPIQIVIIPIYYSEEEKRDVVEYAKLIYERIKDKYRVKLDLDDSKTPGWKFNYYELIGVPIRIEIGLKEYEKGLVTVAIRNRNEKSVRKTLKVDELEENLSIIIQQYESLLENYARNYLSNKIKKVNNLDEFENSISNGYAVKAPFCMREECAKNIKERYQVDVRGTDINPEPATGKCIFCNNEAKYYVYIGRSY